MKTVLDKCETVANSADRMGDTDVISKRFAKELIEESYRAGATAIFNFLRSQHRECNCAKEIEDIINNL